MGSCRKRFKSERVVAPVLVLCLHSLLLTVVVWHQRKLLWLQEPGDLAKWSSVALSVFAYLCVVLQEPGFLDTDPARPHGPPLPMVALYRLVLAPVHVVGRLFASVHRRNAAESAISSLEADGGRGVKKIMPSGGPRKFIPIGRSSLDIFEPLDDEVESDPGEETINPGDLEAPGRGDCKHPVPSGGLVSPARDTTSWKGSCNSSSLGRIPGSPVAGAFAKALPAKQTHRAADNVQCGQKLRWCRVCLVHQPLRTKHCSECGVCVRTHDHHCPWIGTCVSEGNRLYFYWFLWVQSIELTIFLWEANSFLAEHWHGPPLQWAFHFPLLALAVAMMTFLEVMVLLLAFFHTWLAMINLTTWETISWVGVSYLRSIPAEEKKSPFSKSCCGNLRAYCCPPWCFPAPVCCCSDPLERTEDGWAIWEFGEPHQPLVTQCVCPCC